MYDVVGCRRYYQERRHDCDRVGGQRAVLGHRIQCGHHQHGARRPGLAAAADTSVAPSRIHVHHVLWVPAVRELAGVVAGLRIFLLTLVHSMNRHHISTLYICISQKQLLQHTLMGGGFRHGQHVRPNRGPHKKGPPQEDRQIFAT